MTKHHPIDRKPERATAMLPKQRTPEYLTSAEAAAHLGISRKSLYRWIEEGRLPYPLTRETLPAQLGKRPRGPRRNPRSKRYTIGRHTFRPVQSKASGANS